MDILTKSSIAQNITQYGTNPAKKTLLLEKKLELYVNDILETRFSCTGIHLEALVTGYLITMGIINSVDEIECYDIQGDKAHVKVRRRVKKDSHAERESSNFKSSGLFSALDILKQIQLFYQEAYMHKKTGAVHRCVLCNKECMLYSADDMSRRNTIDKVVGMAAMEGVDLSDTYLIFTGRVPMDLIEKLVHAGIPMLIARSFPTYDAVQLAQNNNITLIGNAEKSGFQIYSREWRVVMDTDPEVSSKLDEEKEAGKI